MECKGNCFYITNKINNKKISVYFYTTLVLWANIAVYIK
jgi:hypothetical protein